MKIRHAFVSNSSSSNFIIGLDAYENVRDLVKHILFQAVKEFDDEEEYYIEILEKIKMLDDLDVDLNTPIMIPTVNYDTYVLRRRDGYHIDTWQGGWDNLVSPVENPEILEGIEGEVFFYDTIENVIKKESQIECDNKEKSHERWNPKKVYLPSGEFICEECDEDILKKYEVIKNYDPEALEYEELVDNLWAEADQIIKEAQENKSDTLILQDLSLSALPEEIGELNHLKKLVVMNNYLEKVPESLGNLENLIELRLSKNWIKELPSSLRNLKRLDTLILAENALKKVPEFVYELPNLRVLSLSMNELYSFPAELTAISSIEELYLYKNKISTIPDDINKLRSLKILDLYECKINRIPEYLCELKNLELLNVGINQIDVIPHSINNLIHLKALILRYNKITEIPESMINLKNLEMLDISHNKIEVLPDWIGSLPNLELLYTNSNNIKHLPSSLMELKNLKRFEMDVSGIDEESRELLKNMENRGIIIREMW